MEHTVHRRRAGASRWRGHGRGHALRAASPSQAALVIAAAVVIALAVWALVQLLGLDPVVGRGGGTTPVTTVDVVLATIVAGLGAWAVYALLRRTRRAAWWWPFIGTTALSISTAGPSWLADGTSAVTLTCLHFAVGVVLITGFLGVPWRPGDDA